MSIHDGIVRFYFLPTVASVAAPTVANIAAGTRLTKFTAYNLPSSEAEVDTSDVDSTYDTTAIGTSKAGPIEVTFKYDGNDAMVSLLTFRSAGFLMRSRTGLIVATTKVEVYPVEIGRRRNESYSRNAEQKFMVNFAVTSEPNLDAVIAA